MKTDILALWIAARDRRTRSAAKWIAAIVAAYALSPIDLIPDFIPILGYMDDLLIVPIGIVLAVRLIPEPLMAEFRTEASRRTNRPTSVTAAVAIILLWLALGLCAVRALG